MFFLMLSSSKNILIVHCLCFPVSLYNFLLEQIGTSDAVFLQRVSSHCTAPDR